MYIMMKWTVCSKDVVIVVFLLLQDHMYEGDKVILNIVCVNEKLPGDNW